MGYLGLTFSGLMLLWHFMGQPTEIEGLIFTNESKTETITSVAEEEIENNSDEDNFEPLIDWYGFEHNIIELKMYYLDFYQRMHNEPFENEGNKWLRDNMKRLIADAHKVSSEGVDSREYEKYLEVIEELDWMMHHIQPGNAWPAVTDDYRGYSKEAVEATYYLKAKTVRDILFYEELKNYDRSFAN